MTTYILLANLTDAGAKSVKESIVKVPRLKSALRQEQSMDFETSKNEHFQLIENEQIYGDHSQQLANQQRAHCGHQDAVRRHQINYGEIGD